jgi:single-strand DNA-binding protein
MLVNLVRQKRRPKKLMKPNGTPGGDAMTMNKIIVIGNLGSDPEMRYTPNGQAVTNFNVATNYRYNTASGEQRDETEWFRVSVFGRQAESCNQYLAKGRKVYVDGRLKSRTYQDRNGETRVSLEITAQDVRFLSTTGGGGEGSGPGGGPEGFGAGPGGGGYEPPPGGDIGADDLPF